MPDKYHNRYRIPSARLQAWDYGSNAAYFVTICTKNRQHFFGEIVNTVVGKQCVASLHLTEIGKFVEQEWIKTPELRPDMNLELGEFVIMSNHFHGIMIIGKNKYNTPPGMEYSKDAMHRLSAVTTNNIPPPNNANKFGPQSKNLRSIIRGFKSFVTTQAKKTGNTNFAWQSRFHDHIIRDEKSFARIQNYIINNILNWKEDKFFS